ncbi:beta-carotene ketolase (CrtW type) [Catalinimonas alkaloidigena]|uniref:fatty acid desaturase n=1 Tax=Catalinimonas alkaloidigena TaxID=1075417 RepID=UPI002404E28C|nr:fatty acid desaturase [Catalinimonas alkaloidigena]MDF9796870.1 beta-carotene ketolase (CrtW type) [Catalinimonas alkaloidigena]
MVWYREKGVFISLSIIFMWFISLFCLLHFFEVSWKNPFTYLFMLIQAHLYTGLFITAHDAMHGAVSKHKKVNDTLGKIAAGMFAFNSYRKLFPKHHLHHRFVATEKDPDYHKGNFLSWYIKFALEYVSLWQILLMAATYELLLLAFPKPNVILFYILPSILATLQLFYFGTYLPHRGIKNNKHHSSTQAKNHVWAFVSCYFFGYHYEHHNAPGVPWWRLYKEKEKMIKS